MRTQVVIGLIAACTSSAAFSGYQVEQKVALTGKAGKTDTEFSWKVGDDGAFRVDLKRGADQRFLVFNGKVFYACGKLEKAAVDVVRRLAPTDPALVGRLEKGACQELSTDFGARFFLSPYDAASHVEVSRGFSSNLSVAEPDVELTGSVNTVDKQKCVDFTRSYKVTDRKNTKFEQKVAEKSCNATQIKWRQGLVRELGKAMIRAPGGAPNYKALTSDLKKMAGLTLTAEGSASGKDYGGTEYTRTFAVTTQTAKERAYTAAELGTPAGYEILDAQSLAFSGRGNIAQPVAAKASLKGESNPLADTVKFLLLGGSPAAALTTSLNEQ